MPQRVRSFKNSLPLDRGRRLGGNVIHDSVDALDLIDNSGRHPVQHLVGDAGPVGGHKVTGGDGAQGQGVVIGPAVAHDTHGAGIGEHCKILADILVLTGGRDLLPVDGVGLPEYVQLGLGQVSNDPDGQSRAREGLAHDQILRQSQLTAQLPHLVLEEQVQRLQHTLEPGHHLGGQQAVVVALDDG